MPRECENGRDGMMRCIGCGGSGMVTEWPSGRAVPCERCRATPGKEQCTICSGTGQVNY
jgi:hypothetical protein